jgi:hypothetical protein
MREGNKCGFVILKDSTDKANLARQKQYLIESENALFNRVLPKWLQQFFGLVSLSNFIYDDVKKCSIKSRITILEELSESFDKCIND